MRRFYLICTQKALLSIGSGISCWATSTLVGNGPLNAGLPVEAPSLLVSGCVAS